VTGTDLFQEAAAELYATDPDTFIERRGTLVAQARAAGQAPAAKRIAGLRKPTRSAWVLNQLVRAVPDVPSELARLGQELRAAQKSLDGAAIRELSLRRRQLIETLTRQAFRVSGLDAPSAVLRDEVTATLGAALADPEVADRLAAGTLERAVRSEGFGTGPPTLTLVTSSGGRSPLRAAPVPGAQRGARGPRALAVAGTVAPARPAAQAPAPRAEAAASERERRRETAVAAAEQGVTDAAQAAEAATAAEQKLERAVQVLEEQLADARRSLSDTRAQARRARARQRQARLVLDRLRR
jgi:hypothetical protein